MRSRSWRRSIAKAVVPMMVLMSVGAVGTALPAAAETPLTFSTPQVYPIGEGASFPGYVATGDLNGDGSPDVVSGNYESSNVSVLFNDGSGGLVTPATVVPLQEWGGGPLSLALGDIDADGDLDIVTANEHDGMSVLINDGAGNFTLQGGVNQPVGDYPYSIALTDVDGDTDLDAVILHANSTDLWVMLNDGTGYFAISAQGPIPLNDPYFYYTWVTAGDVDSDGDVDLALAGWDTDDLLVFLNDGSGTFSPSTQNPLTVGDQAYSVEMGDVDGDGDLDLVNSNYGDDTISVLLNDGTGAFSAPVTYSVAPGVEPTVTLADIDGDGDLDALTANHSSGNVSVLVNDGSGVFGTATVYPVNAGSYPGNVAYADGDGDGDLDLVIGDVLVNTVSVLLQTTGEVPSDTTPPVLTVPEDMVVKYRGPADAGMVVTYEATASDNVDGAITPECTPPSGSIFPLGVTTVTCTATDTSGNFATDSFIVTVQRRGIRGQLDMNNGRHGRDIAMVTAPDAARGATVKLFKVRPTGMLVLLATKPANSTGDARFVVTDRRPIRVSTYVAYIGPTSRTLRDWTPTRRIR